MILYCSTLETAVESEQARHPGQPGPLAAGRAFRGCRGSQESQSPLPLSTEHVYVEQNKEIHIYICKYVSMGFMYIHMYMYTYFCMHKRRLRQVPWALFGGGACMGEGSLGLFESGGAVVAHFRIYIPGTHPHPGLPPPQPDHPHHPHATYSPFLPPPLGRVGGEIPIPMSPKHNLSSDCARGPTKGLVGHTVDPRSRRNSERSVKNSTSPMSLSDFFQLYPSLHGAWQASQIAPYGNFLLGATESYQCHGPILHIYSYSIIYFKYTSK